MPPVPELIDQLTRDHFSVNVGDLEVLGGLCSSRVGHGGRSSGPFLGGLDGVDVGRRVMSRLGRVRRGEAGRGRAGAGRNAVATLLAHFHLHKETDHGFQRL